MFYDRLNELCQKKGQSISRVSIEELGCSNGTASGWKKGSQPNAGAVAKAAAYFGVSADYLLGLTNEPRPLHEDGRDYLDENERYLIEKLRACDEKTRQRAMLSALAAMGALPSQQED